MEYLTTYEVAAELGVSWRTIIRWIQAGKLKATKPGKEYRIRRSDLERMLKKHETK